MRRCRKLIALASAHKSSLVHSESFACVIAALSSSDPFCFPEVRSWAVVGSAACRWYHLYLVRVPASGQAGQLPQNQIRKDSPTEYIQQCRARIKLNESSRLFNAPLQHSLVSFKFRLWLLLPDDSTQTSQELGRSWSDSASSWIWPRTVAAYSRRLLVLRLGHWGRKLTLPFQTCDSDGAYTIERG